MSSLMSSNVISSERPFLRANKKTITTTPQSLIILEFSLESEISYLLVYHLFFPPKRKAPFLSFFTNVFLLRIGCCLSLLKLPLQSQTGWLTQQNFISHSSGNWEVQDQGATKVDFILRLLLLACGGIISLCALSRDQSLVFVPLLIRILIVLD